MEPAAPSPAEIGEVLGGYRLLSILGRGGMGCVYEAEHERLGRRAAVKVLASELAGDTSFVSRFFQEARLVNEIRHPNIIDIIDFVETNEPRRVAYVMELLPGVSLKSVLEAGRLQVVQAVNACYQLANALSAVHARGAVHRDLKPDNIFVVGRLESDLGEVPSVKILDFGIAKTESGAALHRTRTGMILGTPTYMAPEQITAEPVSAGTDTYALAEIFYEMISGQKIFVGADAPSLLRAKLIGDPGRLPLPDGIGGAEAIRSLVRACLAQRPEDRPPIEEVKKQLLIILEASAGAPAPAAHVGVLATNVAPTPVSMTPLERPRPRPRSTGVIVAAGLVVAVGIAGLFAASSSSSEPQVEALAPDLDPDEDEADQAVPEGNVTPAQPRRPRSGKKSVDPQRAPAAKAVAPGPEPRPRRRTGNGIMDELEDLETAFGDAANRVGNDLDFDGAPSLARRGDRALEDKDYGEAKRLYQRCLQKRQMPECHRGLGYAFLGLKDRLRANEHFAHYLELSPDAADTAKIAKAMTPP